MCASFTPSNFHFSGSIDLVPVEQVCQLIAGTNRTGMLEFAFEGFSAHVYFDEGRVVAVDYAGMKDQEAFDSFVAIRRGLFEFFPDEKPKEKRMSASVQAMLLEAFRQEDEHPPEPPVTIPRDFKGVRVLHNTLYCNRNLNNPLDMEFEIACRQLLVPGDKILVIDLTHVNIIISQYLGAIAAVAAEARRSDRRIIVRVRKTVSEILYRLRFDQLMEIETCIDTSELPWIK
jgi:hypothetical protein